MSMTLADLQSKSIVSEPAKADAPVFAAADLPAVIEMTASITKLGTETARTRYEAKGFDGVVKALVYLPGELPEAFKGQTLELTFGEAESSKPVTDNPDRSKVTWNTDTAQGKLTVYGYLPADAKHVTGMSITFPKGK